MSASSWLLSPSGVLKRILLAPTRLVATHSSIRKSLFSTSNEVRVVFCIPPRKYPTDYCNSDPSDLDCFTRGILDAKAQAKQTPFLITEYSCGWKNSAIHGGESTAYAASFALRTVTALAASELDAFSWWTFSMLCTAYPELPGASCDMFTELLAMAYLLNCRRW